MAVRKLTFQGQTRTIGEWAALTNQSHQSLRWRLAAGWPLNEALSAPRDKRGRPVKDRAPAVKATKIKREFARLVGDIDHALTVFRNRLNWLLNEDEDRGVGQQPRETPNDRAIHSTQDCS